MSSFLSRTRLIIKPVVNSTTVKYASTSSASASASQVGLKKDESTIVLESSITGGQKRIDAQTLKAAESGAITPSDKKKEKATFAKLFKESKFVALSGTPSPRLIGKIVHVVNDDLYIDYGGKFNCICKRPKRNSRMYVRNANVEIKLKSFEMASYFLNSAKHLTLLESDAEIVGLVAKTPSPSSSGASTDEQLTNDEINELNSEENYL